MGFEGYECYDFPGCAARPWALGCNAVGVGQPVSGAACHAFGVRPKGILRRNAIPVRLTVKHAIYNNVDVKLSKIVKNDAIASRGCAPRFYRFAVDSAVEMSFDKRVAELLLRIKTGNEVFEVACLFVP